MALDLRPRVVFHTSLGAVVTIVDPATPFGGVIQVPGVGNVPYDVDWTAPSMTVHLPTYGDQVIPLIPTGGPSSFSIPGLGDVTYEVVFGPVDIPPEQLASTYALTIGFNPWIIGLAGIAVFLLMRPKRNPRRKKWDVGERVEFRRSRRRLTLPPHRHLNPCNNPMCCP